MNAVRKRTFNISRCRHMPSLKTKPPVLLEHDLRQVTGIPYDLARR